MAGEPLLRGVSFKLERRERHDHRRAQRRRQDDAAADARRARRRSTAASWCSPRARASRCTTSARRASATSRLRDYVLSRLRASRSSSRPSCGASSRRWPTGDEQAMNRYAGVQARFEAVGGYGWRERARAVVHGLGFADDDLDRPLKTFSGGQLTRGSLARALAAQPDLLLLDEPTNHLDIESLEWLEQTLLGARRGDRARRPRPLVPGDGRHRRARARGRPRALLQRHLARVAPRAGRARARARPRDREAAGRDRAHGALRRALPLQGDQGAPGAGRASRSSTRSSASSATRATARALEFAFKKPERSGRVIFELEDGRLQVGADRRASCSPTPSCGSSAASTSRSSGPTAPARRRSSRRWSASASSTAAACARATTSRSATSASTPRSSRAAARAPCSRRRSSAPGCRPTRRARCSAASSSAARRSTSRSTASAAASAGACRWRSSSQSGANVLILDEPTNHLDLESREALEDALQVVPGLAHPRHPRPRAARRRRHAHDRRRGLRAALLRRRLGRVRPRARGAQGDGGCRPRSPPPPATQRRRRAAPKAPAAKAAKAARQAASPTGPRRTASASRRASSAPSRRPRRRSRRSRTSWPTPGVGARSTRAAKSTARHTAAKRAVEEAYAALEAFEAKV